MDTKSVTRLVPGVRAQRGALTHRLFVEPPLPAWIRHPRSPLTSMWEVTQVFLLIYVSFSVLYRIGFNVDVKAFSFWFWFDVGTRRVLPGLCTSVRENRMLVRSHLNHSSYSPSTHPNPAFPQAQMLVDLYFICDIALNIRTVTPAASCHDTA